MHEAFAVRSFVFSWFANSESLPQICMPVFFKAEFQDHICNTSHVIYTPFNSHRNPNDRLINFIAFFSFQSEWV